MFMFKITHQYLNVNECEITKTSIVTVNQL